MYNISILPVSHILLSPTWGSQVSGPCKLFLFYGGTQTLQSHNPHRTWQCSHQSFPWKYQWNKKSVRVKGWKIFKLVGYIKANLSLSRLQTSPPRHASSNMYTNLLSLNVRYILRGENIIIIGITYISKYLKDKISKHVGILKISSILTDPFDLKYFHFHASWFH